MRPKTLKKAIRQSLAMNVPLMVWGSPGLGKSKIIRQTVEEDGYLMEDLRLSTMDTVDLRGFPDKKEDKATWLRPSFFPDTGKKTVLLLDEITQCNSELQGASLQMVYDFALGEHPLPPETRLILAGNRSIDRTGANKMISALKNRVIHVQAESHYEDWLEFAMGQGYWSSVTGYIHFQPQHLNTFDPTKDQDSFATPRTWEMVSKLEDCDEEILMDMVSGLVGKEIAPSFVAFDRLTTKIDVEGILKNPDTAPIPDKADARYALMTGVASRLKRNIGKYVEGATRLALRFDKDGFMEFTVACIKAFQSSHKDYQLKAIERVDEFSKWLTDNHQYVQSVFQEVK